MENSELASLLEAKDKRRQQLAQLPIKEKVRILIRLQKISAPILKQRGKAVVCWEEET